MRGRDGVAAGFPRGDPRLADAQVEPEGELPDAVGMLVSGEVGPDVLPDLRAGARDVGAAHLAAELERQARTLGARELVLETGDRQPESLAVYRRAGFRKIPRFGEYLDSPLSLCMGKAL